MAMTDLLALLGLFATCLAAGSVVPIPSEAAFVALLLGSDFAPWTLVVIATAGNVTGSSVNWLIGRGAARLAGRRWFPVSEAGLDRGRAWYHRYGRWSLLMSWIPIVGDPLTITAGVMREPFWSFLLIVSIAKFARYGVLASATLYFV